MGERNGLAFDSQQLQAFLDFSNNHAHYFTCAAVTCHADCYLSLVIPHL